MPSQVLRLDGQNIGVQLTGGTLTADFFIIDVTTGAITSGVDSSGKPFLTAQDIRNLKTVVDEVFALVPNPARDDGTLSRIIAVSSGNLTAVTVSAAPVTPSTVACRITAAASPAYINVHLPFSSDGNVAWASGSGGGGGGGGVAAVNAGTGISIPNPLVPVVSLITPVAPANGGTGLAAPAPGDVGKVLTATGAGTYTLAAGGGGGAPSGPAGGDLNTTYPNPRVEALSGGLSGFGYNSVVGLRYPTNPFSIFSGIVAETAPATKDAIGVSIVAGSTTDLAKKGGGLTITAAPGTAATATDVGGNGGDLRLGADPAVGAPGYAKGGDALAGATPNAAGTGGRVFIDAGKGGAAASNAAGAGAAGVGGVIEIEGGEGGPGTVNPNAQPGGVGGAVTVAGGNGGLGTVDALAGNGGELILKGGQGGTTPGNGANGGNVTIRGGFDSLAGGTPGSPGWVRIPESRFATPGASSVNFTNNGAGSTAQGIVPTGRVQIFTAPVPLNFDAHPVAVGVEQGEELILINESGNAVTFFSGAITNLRLGAASRVVGSGGSLHLIWSQGIGRWLEIAWTTVTV